MLAELRDARKFILNYSGESTVYPDLIPAIRQARATGAFVELVSVLTTAPESLLAPLTGSGLNRLTVSVHAADPAQYAAIYRYGSWDTLRARLERLLELGRHVPHPPVVDLAFVAMDANLAELPSVASFAGGLGLRHISIFPVIRRDEIPIRFPIELTAAGTHRPDFAERLQRTVDRTAARHPQIRFAIASELSSALPALGEVPVSYAGMLPPGAHIHSCEQNPWETAHVLSSGDVVACEVLDKIPLGNLHQQSLTEIWHGERYRRFRERYRHGEVAECRACPWKKAYRPAPLASEILGARGSSAQLLYGWHEPAGEPHIWSSQQALAILAPRRGSRTLHVCGMLPPGPEGSPNELTVVLNGTIVGKVANPWQEVVPFGLDFAVAASPAEPWTIEFRTTHMFRPSERGTGTDQRDLGFALVLVASKEFVDLERAGRKQQELQTLGGWIRAFDRWSIRCARHLGRTSANGSAGSARPGLSVIIPERDNLPELADCLAGLRTAAARWPEPLEIIVVVNGTPARAYQSLRDLHRGVRWRFFRRPLGFSAAVRAGLESARYPWVYLLNSDVVLDPDALLHLAPYRSAEIFSVASQIFLRDTTRFRDETNWGALLVESGLATIHDWIPRSSESAPTFYAGGGASLFQRRLLRSLMDVSAYAPFYWEDVEWGWRARKLGYRSLFCPASVAHHRQRATIDRHYTAAEVERILRRNRLLFQLRNFTTAGSLERALEEIARAEAPVADWFLHPRSRWTIARGRFWNHRAPVSDEGVFETWNRSISSC